MNRISHVVFSTLTLVCIVLLSGCTPDQEQAVRDGINTAVQNEASQAIGFVLDFGRQALAAFLL